MLFLGPGAAVEGNADYVPSFGAPQLFRWHGYWVEITRFKESQVAPYGNYRSFASLQLMSVIWEYYTSSLQLIVILNSIYTREMTVLSALVEEARLRYNETSKQHVTVYSVDSVGSDYSYRYIQTYYTLLA